MTPPMTPFRRLLRNLRWYFEDIVAGVTGKGTLHFRYGPGRVPDFDLSPSVNPATGLPMADQSVDVMGNPYGLKLRS